MNLIDGVFQPGLSEIRLFSLHVGVEGVFHEGVGENPVFGDDPAQRFGDGAAVGEHLAYGKIAVSPEAGGIAPQRQNVADAVVQIGLQLTTGAFLCIADAGEVGDGGAAPFRPDGVQNRQILARVRAAGTVGAGDGFATGVISGCLEKLPMAEAVRRGNAIGAIVITSKGDNENLPTRDELIKFMGNNGR